MYFDSEYVDVPKFKVGQLLVSPIVPLDVWPDLQGFSFPEQVIIDLISKYKPIYSFISIDLQNEVKKLLYNHLDHIMNYDYEVYSYFNDYRNVDDAKAKQMCIQNLRIYDGAVGKMYARIEKKLNQFYLYQSVITDLEVFKDGGKRLMNDQVDNTGTDTHSTDYGKVIQHLYDTIVDNSNSEFYKSADTPNLLEQDLTDFIDKFTNEMNKSVNSSTSNKTGTDSDNSSGNDTKTITYGKSTKDVISVEMKETFENIYNNITKYRENIISDICDVIIDAISFPYIDTDD